MINLAENPEYRDSYSTLGLSRSIFYPPAALADTFHV
jgi:hypothetical protein